MSKNSIYDIKKIAALYGEEFKKYGYSLTSLMIPKGASDARFKTKFDIGKLDDTRILDVGCGFGHMLDYLKAWDIRAQYTGIDIFPPFIEIAKQRHPGADFRVLNILEQHPKNSGIGYFWLGPSMLHLKKSIGGHTFKRCSNACLIYVPGE